MNILIDIDHSFIRQPIKIALSKYLQDKVSFVTSEEVADLIIGIPNNHYTVPCILLSDDPHTLVSYDTCLNISPTPTNKDEMHTLVLKVADYMEQL